MPSWKKMLVSGSDASLNSLNITTALTASGLIYPTSDGIAGQVVTTDGLGNLSFGDITATSASHFAEGLITASNDFSEITFTKDNGDTFVLDATGNHVHEFVKNKEPYTLVKGTPVYVSGSTGNASHVYAASASRADRMPAAYVLDEDIISDAEGYALLTGFINNVNTSQFLAGDSVYVGPSGGYTNVKPTGSNFIQKLGNVIKVDAANGSGVITGAGRANDIPNILENHLWIGNIDGVATPTSTGSLSGSFTLLTVHNQASGNFSERVSNLEITGSIHENRLDSIELATGSFVNAGITGSSLITASFTGDTLTFTKGDSSTFPVTIQPTTASYSVTSSYALTSGGDITVTNNTNNNILTATGTANEINGESGLTYDGTQLIVTGSVAVSGSVQIGNNANTPSVDLVGTLRYREDSTNSYVDMCMKTALDPIYSWVNILTNTLQFTPPPATGSVLLQVDFGRNFGGYVSPSPWNNFNDDQGTAVGARISSLTDTNSNTTGLALEITQAFNGFDTNTTAVDELYIYEATRDCIQTVNGTPGILQLQGCNSSKVYDLKFFSSRGYVGTSTQFTIDGSSQSINHKGGTNTGNLTDTVTFTGISPDAFGYIDITVTGVDAGSNDIGYLNVMEITQRDP